MTAPLRFALVPLAPTNEIQIAGLTALDDSDATPPSIGHQIGYKAVRESYAAMLAASPGNDLLQKIVDAKAAVDDLVWLTGPWQIAVENLLNLLDELGGSNG